MKQNIKNSITLLLGLFFMSVAFAQELGPEYSEVNPGGAGWADSYQSNGLCWCKSSFDHGLDDGSVTFVINGEKRYINEICDELKNHPDFESYANGDALYNDIQCGNGPANNHDIYDETYCPGLVTEGNEGCTVTGPTWDLAWLASRTRFGGNGSSNSDQIIENGDYYIEHPNLNERLYSDFEISYNSKMEVESAAGESQIWNFIYLGNDIYSIRNQTNYRYLEVNSALCSNSANVGTWYTNEDSHQKWKVVANGDNYNLLPLHCTGKALDRSRGIPGAEAVIYNYTTSNFNQKWNLTPVNDQQPPTGNVVTILAESIENYISYDDAYPNYVRANNETTNNTFVMETNTDGTVSFKSSTGKYISSENSKPYVTCNRETDTPGTWERFELELLESPNVYAIKWKNKSGVYTYLCHENNEMPMNCNRPAVGLWERFVIESVDEHSSTQSNKSLLNSISNSVASTTFFPNPVSSNDVLSVQIVLDQSISTTIQIIDLSGKLIAGKTYSNLEEGINYVTLSELQDFVLTPGLYFLKMKTNNQIITKKIQFNF